MFQEHPTVCAIVVAGGRGTRASGADGAESADNTLPKQYQTLARKPVIQWSLEALAGSARVQHIVVVCAPEFRSLISGLNPDLKLHFAEAGATRTASVRAGLAVARACAPEIVLIHDAARPGLGEPILTRLLDALVNGADGAAPMLHVADALWSIQDQVLTEAIDRSRLTRVQTPQAFWFDKIDSAYAGLPPHEEHADDVAVARAAGLQIVGVRGDARLDKITWPEDFKRMEAIISPIRLPRVGTGFDAHKFGAGDHVTLCGIAIPHAQGLAGHSDADVGWHALADAIYGALSAGDIGHHFPPSDPRWKGAHSSTFLAHAGRLVGACGGLVHHVDLTLICEAPRIGPHRLAMIEATAKVLGLRPDQISIKATTTEGMGFTGRREGIAAQACATLLLPDDFRTVTEVPLI